MEGMKSRIFIVEDHKLVRDSYIMFLNMTDDLVVCGAVRTAEEALEQLDTMKPDLLLVDLSLPGMSGIELLKELKANKTKIPALVLTGHDNDVYRKGAARAGARGFELKKNDPDLLIESIRRVLDEERAARP
jgi:DNA-binding NarL/FixJ family response regulator